MLALAIFLVLCLLLYAWLRKGSAGSSDPSTTSSKKPEARRDFVTATFKTYDPEQYKARNEKRQKWLKQRYPDADKWIFTKVAGASHRNQNGSDRQRILRRCTAAEELRLIAEPDNPFDANAIAVCRGNGEQLGYLGQRLAEEMHRWMARGENWSAVLTEVTGRDKRELGANIALVRKKASEAQAATHQP